MSIHERSLFAAALTAALTVTTAYMQTVAAEEATPGYNQKIPDKIMTPDTVETRIGTLKFFDGLPTKETSQKVYDNLDFMRAVEVFLNFIPAASIEAIRLGMAEQGAVKGDVSADADATVNAALKENADETSASMEENADANVVNNDSAELNAYSQTYDQSQL